MVRIAYLLLCHARPDDLIAQIRLLRQGGDPVTVHLDAAAPAADMAKLRHAFENDPDVAFVGRRYRCGWGEWSLVAATLEMLRVAADRFADATHFYLISGDCLPIRPRADIAAALAAGDRDHIESVDFFTSGWIRTGLVEERLIYRHFVNERRHPGLFYGMLDVQKRLGLRRPLPPGLDIRIGAQWWCLRRATVLGILHAIARDPGTAAFFRRTWIPDETFFQTLAAQLVPLSQIDGRSPTFGLFTDYGLPVVFHDDHADFLLDQPRFFARKIAPEAVGLRTRLAGVYMGDGPSPAPSGRGRAVHAFVTGQGRAGLRFGAPAWSRDAGIGRGRRLLMIASHSREIGARLATAAAQATGAAAVGHVFDDPDAPLPALGGLERGATKRNRQKRAFVRLLFERLKRNALILCIDPCRDDLVHEFAGDGCETRLLYAACDMSDRTLDAHAERIGLVGPGTPRTAFDSLREPLRAAQARELAALESAGVPFRRIAENGDPSANARALAGFLDIGEDAARAVLATHGLFD
jgi:hypothetical protein